MAGQCGCEEMRQIVREEIANLKGKRTKRAPSKYNLCIKECIPEKTGPIQDRFKSCALGCKEKKAG